MYGPVNTKTTEQPKQSLGIGSAALSVGSGVASSLIGMIGQKKREKRQQKRQIELMDKQQANQMALNQQGQDLSLDYSKQVDKLKEAGLNVGMMYGGQGAGGRTGPGGSAASGQAAMSQGMPEMMGIEQTMAMKRLENESKLAESQSKLNEANAEARAGVETDKGNAAIQEIEQNIENSKVDTESKRIVAESVKSLNEQKVQESIVNTDLGQADLDWMKETGVNRNDSIVAKTVKYFAQQTGLTEKQVIGILGGALALERALKLIPGGIIEGALKGKLKGKKIESKGIDGNKGAIWDKNKFPNKGHWN